MHRWLARYAKISADQRGLHLRRESLVETILLYLLPQTEFSAHVRYPKYTGHCDAFIENLSIRRVSKSWHAFVMEKLFARLAFREMATGSKISNLSTLKNIASVGRGKWVKILDFSAVKILIDSVFIETVERCPFLHTISVRKCSKLTDHAVFDTCRMLRKLDSLDLSYSTRLSGRALYRMLQKRPKFGMLVELKISGLRYIDDRLVDNIVRATGKELRSLSISSLGLTDESMRSIVLHAPSLRRLKASDNLFTDHGVLDFGLNDLEVIDLGGNEKLTDSSIIDLVQRC